MKSHRSTPSASPAASRAPQAARSGAGPSNAERQERLRSAAGKAKSIGDAQELQRAFRQAQPGDWFRLEDGVYHGQFKMRNIQGTDENPIRFEGSSKAMLDGGDGTTTLQMDGVEHTHLSGFTILGGQRGLILNGSNHNEMNGLTVKNTRSEAVHFKQSSAYNTIQNTYISKAGQGDKKHIGNGEGIYIGSDSKKWDSYGGQDKSDHNKVLNNYIEGTSSEAIDVKEGTRNTLIEGNVLVGDRIAGENGAESLIDLKGSHSTVRNNDFINPNGNNNLKNGWEVTRRPWKGNRKDGGTSGMNNVLEGNRYAGIQGGGKLVSQTNDGNSWKKDTSGPETIGQHNQSTQPTVDEWRKGQSPAKAQSPDSKDTKAPSWREAEGRWEPTRAKVDTALLDGAGKPRRNLSKGDAIWVRTDSQTTDAGPGGIGPRWRVMLDSDGKGTEEKGWVAATALASRFQAAGPTHDGKTPEPKEDSELDKIPVPSGQSNKDDQFPQGIAQMLHDKTGLDSEQWDNITDLIAKSEQDQEKGWNSNPAKFYGSCERLEYDKDKRGWTISAFGATTGGSISGDAGRLFTEAGTSAKELGVNNKDRFKENVAKLGRDPAWQKAVWTWFHKEYIAPSVSHLQSLGYTSALTIAAVTDCALNQGFSGTKDTAEALMNRIKNPRSEAEFLRKFLDERAKVVDTNDYNANGNGKRRVDMYRKLLDGGQMDLRDKDKVRKAMSWRMH